MALIIRLAFDTKVLIAGMSIAMNDGLRFMLVSREFKSAADEALKRAYDSACNDPSLLSVRMRALRERKMQITAAQGLPASNYSELWSIVLRWLKCAEVQAPFSIFVPAQFDRICTEYVMNEPPLEDTALVATGKILLSKNGKPISFQSEKAEEAREWLKNNSEEAAKMTTFIYESTEEFKRLPVEIGMCSLKILKITKACGFAWLPDEINAVAQLEEIEIAKENKVSVLPPLFGLVALKRMCIAGNALKSFPDLRGLNNLVKVDVSHNHIDYFPPEVWDRNYELWIEGNVMSAIPKGLGKEWKRLLNGTEDFIHSKSPFRPHFSKSILIDDRASSYASLYYYTFMLYTEMKDDNKHLDFVIKKMKKQLSISGRMDLETVVKNLGKLDAPRPTNGLSKNASQIWQVRQDVEKKRLLKEALFKVAVEEFDKKDKKIKEKVFELIYRFGGSPQPEEEGIKWGEAHLKEDRFRFLVAYDCVARGMFS